MSDQNQQTEVKPTLNGAPVTQEQIQEEKAKLPGNQRIIEIKPGENRKLTRFQE